MTFAFRRTVEALFTLAPFLIALYLWQFQEPPLILRNHLLHELAVGVACALGTIVTAVALHAYRRTGEFFTRYLALAFGGFTALYTFHGLLTRLDGLPITFDAAICTVEANGFWVFILFGPMSRLVLAAFITIGVIGYDRSREPQAQRSRRMLWAVPMAVIGAAGIGTIVLALSPIAADKAIRLVMESMTVTLCAVTILRLLWRKGPFGMKPYLILGLALTAQSALIFLMTGGWTHLWWLAHVIGAAGFLAMSYGLARSAQTGWSLTQMFSEDEMRAQLDQARRASLAMRAAKEEAEAASRSKSEFLAAMSHELRTPLNAIIGFSDMMQSEVHGPLGKPQYADYSTIIGDSGRHLLAVINDVLDVSRIEAGSLELEDREVIPAQVLGSALTMVRDRAKRSGIQIEVEAPEVLPCLRGDPRRIKQILLNLLSNAVKFSHANGTVRVAMNRSFDGGLVISVADTGIGMDPKDIPKALSVFGQVDSRLERRFEGTGLGLPLVNSMMALHDGRLEIKSAPGKGTTVTLTFPPQRILARPCAGNPASLSRPDGITEPAP